MISDITDELSENIWTIDLTLKLIDDLIESEIYLEAEKLCENILEINENNVEILTRYLKILNLTDQHEKVIGVIEEIQKIDLIKNSGA
jgi:hypothetical protein